MLLKESLQVLFYCSFHIRIRGWEKFSSSIVPILLMRTVNIPEGEWKGKEAVDPVALMASILFFPILITLLHHEFFLCLECKQLLRFDFKGIYTLKSLYLIQSDM